MQALRFILPLLFGLALLGSTSCKKDDPEKEGLSYVDGVPYYHFTDADRLWLRTKPNDEWKLENSQGYQRVYRVSVIAHDIQKGEYRAPGFISPSKPERYIDRIYLRLNRTDSTRLFSELRFCRNPALLTGFRFDGYDPNRSEFTVEGEWPEFVGNTGFNTDFYNCRGLKFPRGATLNGPFQQLTVRGRTYPDVVAFIGTPRGPNCAPVPAYFMKELYYDRQAGLIRMVSLAGEIWDRVP